MKLKRGYTLSEIMIALVVLGTIIACCMPIISNMAPNKHAIMLKKAYFTTQQIVSDLINDSYYYPNGNFEQDADVNIDEIAEQLGVGTIANGAKLKCLFASKLNLDASSNNSHSLNDICSDTIQEGGNYNTYNSSVIFTNDGMVWNFGFCPVVDSHNKWICRVDISTTQDIKDTGYDLDPEECIDIGNGWGVNICGQGKIHVLGKMALFIDPDGRLSLKTTHGTFSSNFGGDNTQTNIQNIITGKTSLLGKPKN